MSKTISTHGQARGRHKNNNAAGLLPNGGRELKLLRLCFGGKTADLPCCRKLRIELLTSFETQASVTTLLLISPTVASLASSRSNMTKFATAVKVDGRFYQLESLVLLYPMFPMFPAWVGVVNTCLWRDDDDYFQANGLRTRAWDIH